MGEDQLAWRGADSPVAAVWLAAQPVERVEEAVNFFFPGLPRLPVPIVVRGHGLLPALLRMTRPDRWTALVPTVGGLLPASPSARAQLVPGRDHAAGLHGQRRRLPRPGRGPPRGEA